MRGRSEVYWSQSRKFSNCGDTNDGDLISNLPECVLSRILSCLPAKDAVRTCVLSKVWEYRWISIYDIVVEDRELPFYEQRNDEASFMKFMDRILLLSHNVRSFDLVCHGSYNGSRVETWICALFRRNVEIVSLSVNPCQGVGQGVVVLPRSLLYCTSLTDLVIDMSCTFKVPVKICFPNLTCLSLTEVQILNDNPSTDTLTFVFPVMTRLELRDCRWLRVRFVEFCAPCLSTFISEPMSGIPDDYLIKISAARIEKFHVCGDDVENFLLTGSRILRAIVYTADESEEHVLSSGFGARKLLTELSSISFLTLSCYAARAIAQTKQGRPLPKFGNLRELKLSCGADMKDHIANVEALFDLLHAAPFLTTLVIEDNIFMQPHDDFDYCALMSVPSCIISYLKIVKFVLFSNEAPLLHLAMFLLKHGMKLAEFSFPHCRVDTSELEGQISNMPKASAFVSIVIN